MRHAFLAYGWVAMLVMATMMFVGGYWSQDRKRMTLNGVYLVLAILFSGWFHQIGWQKGWMEAQLAYEGHPIEVPGLSAFTKDEFYRTVMQVFPDSGGTDVIFADRVGNRRFLHIEQGPIFPPAFIYRGGNEVTPYRPLESLQQVRVAQPPAPKPMPVVVKAPTPGPKPKMAEALRPKPKTTVTIVTPTKKS